jgi:hypothetical protein
MKCVRVCGDLSFLHPCSCWVHHLLSMILYSIDRAPPLNYRLYIICDTAIYNCELTALTKVIFTAATCSIRSYESKGNSTPNLTTVYTDLSTCLSY